ncbi:YrhB domain-containing protein [Kitasatospora sp. NPDC058965]|uniref:YrhB domain-containing protein n=1 Tax=Kitasatospora sp. NPDC058965 TaxID=3346682 RepID=UPI003682E892
MISTVGVPREAAIGLVEAWLARERVLAVGACRWSQKVVVSGVEEHPPGWLVFCQSAAYLRTRNPEHLLAGVGPLLVDASDGSLHLIPRATYETGEWQDLYRYDVKGEVRPDPVVTLVGSVLETRGPVAALRELRRNAPGMSIGQARAYVAALASRQTPGVELTALTRPPEASPTLPLTTLTLAPVAAPQFGARSTAARSLGYYRELMPGEAQAPTMLTFLRANPTEDDPALCSYLRAGTPLVATTTLTSCCLTPTNRPLGSWALLTDGTWLWPGGLAHYVEQHHLRLPPDFVRHAHRHGWTPPYVGAQRLADLEREFCGAEEPAAPGRGVSGS